MTFRLLIADDEELVRRGLTALIAREVPDVTVVGAAADGFEALRMAAETDPDIVCTDIRMPGLSGLDLIERLRATRPALRSIILSGYDDFGYARRAIGLGVAEYLLKPVDAEQLLRILARMREDIARERQEERVRQDAARITQEQAIRRLLDGLPVDPALLAACLPPAPAWGLALVYPSREETAPDGADDALAAACRAATPGSTVVLDAYGYYCALYPLDREDKDVAAGAARRLYETLRASGWSAQMTVARPCATVAELTNAYHEAIAGADYYPVAADAEPLLCWDVLPTRTERWPVLPRAHRDALLDAVAEGAGGDAERAARSFMAYLRECMAPGARRALWVEMIVLLIDHVQQRGVRADAVLDSRHNPWTLLAAGGDVGDLEERFLALVARAAGACQALARRQAPRGTIAELRAYIEDHLDADLTITTLARRAHLNAKYLGELFKDVTGEPLGEYIIRARMRRACALLADSSLKIYSIAEKVGYSSPKHFTTMFRTIVGVAPAEYREQRRQSVAAPAEVLSSCDA